MADPRKIDSADFQLRATDWLGLVALDKRTSGLAMRCASYLAFCHARGDSRVGVPVSTRSLAEAFGVSEAAVVRALAELIAYEFVDVSVCDGDRRYYIVDPTCAPAPQFEESDEDFKRHARRRAKLKAKWLEMLPGASDAELLLLGVEAIQTGEAGLFDLAAIVGAPATVIVGDFERIAGRKATRRDWNGGAF